MEYFLRKEIIKPIGKTQKTRKNKKHQKIIKPIGKIKNTWKNQC